MPAEMLPKVLGKLASKFGKTITSLFGLLFSFAAGGSAQGATFTRSTTAMQMRADGVYESVAINTLRGGHYIGGVLTALLEGESTNLCLQSTDTSSAYWQKTGVTTSYGVMSPYGSLTATTITATAAAGAIYQQLAAASNTYAGGLWVRRRTGAGIVSLVGLDGVRIPIAVTSTWTRFSSSLPAITNPYWGVEIATSGDAVDIWNGQVEAGSFVTSDILTVEAPVKRAADNSQNVFNSAPQVSTFFVKFVEGGTVKSPNTRALQVGADAAPFLAIFSTGSHYALHHHNGSASVQATLISAPSIGDTVELRGVLYPNGSAQIHQSINGAAETSSPVTGALALAAAWNGTNFSLANNSGGTLAGFMGAISVKVAAGVKTLEEMRAM